MYNRIILKCAIVPRNQQKKLVKSTKKPEKLCRNQEKKNLKNLLNGGMKLETHRAILNVGKKMNTRHMKTVLFF